MADPRAPQPGAAPVSPPASVAPLVEPAVKAAPAPAPGWIGRAGSVLSSRWRKLPVVGRIALGVALLALAAGLVWLALFNRPPPPVLLTEAARRGDVEISVLATGALVPFLQIDVGSRASGEVVSLRVDAGDEVKAGDLIANIDSSTQTNNLDTARAALNDVVAQQTADRAALDAAQLAFDRARNLAGAEAGPVADVETATHTLKAAKALLVSVAAQIEQARIAVKTAGVNLAYTRITAPIAGTVLAVTNRQGQTVNAAQSAPTIVTLGQLDRMTIDAEIAEADVIRVRPGMAVYFTILGDPDHRITGRLRAIAPAPTSYVSAAGAIAAAASNTAAAAVYYNGIFDVDNPGRRLRTTMTANVSIVLAAARGVLTIPSGALGPVAADGAYPVRVVGKDRAVTSRAVRIGLNDTTRVQVLSGLSEGDRVVIGEGVAGAAAPATAAVARPRGMPRTVGGL